MIRILPLMSNRSVRDHVDMKGFYFLQKKSPCFPPGLSFAKKIEIGCGKSQIR